MKEWNGLPLVPLRILGVQLFLLLLFSRFFSVISSGVFDLARFLVANDRLCIFAQQLVANL